MKRSGEQVHTIDLLQAPRVSSKIQIHFAETIVENQARGELTQQQEKSRSYLCSTVTPAQCAQLLNLLCTSGNQ